MTTAESAPESAGNSPMHDADHPLVAKALELYISKASKDLADSKPWIRQPNNLISVVAIFISILGVFYGFYKDHVDSIDKNLQELSTTVSDLTKLDTDLITAQIASLRATSLASQAPTGTSAAIAPFGTPQQNEIRASVEKFKQQELLGMSEYGRVISNRRLTLLAEADRLVNNLGRDAPPNQLAVLGTAFSQILDYTKAEKYFSKTTDDKNPIPLRVAGLKSLAIVEFQRGRAFYDASRDAFRKASALVVNPTDIGSIGLVIDLDQAWAGLEESAGDLDAALERLFDARSMVLKMPCPAGAQALLARVDGSIQMLNRPHPDGTPRRADVAAKMITFRPGGYCDS